MYQLIVNGRKRRHSVLDEHDEPQTTFDTTPMKLVASNLKSAHAEAKTLLAEYQDAPGATVTVKDGSNPEKTESLQAWLVAAAVIAAPKVATLPVQPVIQPIHHGVVGTPDTVSPAK